MDCKLVTFVILLFQLLLTRRAMAQIAESDSRMAAKTFLYFAYGSNLLEKRIHIQNPSAVRKDIGKLKNHRLDFSYYSKRWGGAPATIVPDTGREVWGAIWEIDIKNMPDLDNQEGVHQNFYRPLQLPIETPFGEILECRAYMLVNNPGELPKNKRFTSIPSQLYMYVIKSGAVESGLPRKYIDFLKSIEHNGKKGNPFCLTDSRNSIYYRGDSVGPQPTH